MILRHAEDGCKKSVFMVDFTLINYTLMPIELRFPDSIMAFFSWVFGYPCNDKR